MIQGKHVTEYNNNNVLSMMIAIKFLKKRKKEKKRGNISKNSLSISILKIIKNLLM
jgi:hypothetical protein